MRIDVTVEGADGRMRDVAILATPGIRWGEVRALLPGDAVSEVDPGTVLGTGPLRDGTLLRRDRGDGGSGPDGGAAPCGHRLDVVGGPDAGLSTPLGRTPVTVGRSPACDLVLGDPRASRLHAEVRLGPRGTLVRDLGSAAGTHVGGLPVAAGPAVVPSGAVLRLGDTFLRVTQAGARPAAARAGPDGTVLVTPVPAPARTGPPEQIALPDPPRSDAEARVQWLGALLPAALGAVLALAMHSPQFLLFALLSPLMLLGSAVGDRLHRRRVRWRTHRDHRRDLARARGQIAAALAREAAARRARAPDPVTVAETARHRTAGLWTRRREQPGQLNVRLGLGELAADTCVRDSAGTRPAGRLADVPVCADLADGPLGITGSPGPASATARWALAQLASLVSPADVEFHLLLTPDTEPRWRWARWLPHLAGPPVVGAAEHAEVLSTLTALRDTRAATTGAGGEPAADGWPGSWAVLVVDDWSAAAELPGLADLLRTGPAAGITAIVLDTRQSGLPPGCATVATVAGDTGSGLEVTFRPGPDPGTTVCCGPTVAVADQPGPTWAEQLARTLAPLRVAAGAAAGLPERCTLPEVLGLRAVDPHSILDRWRRSDAHLGTVLGVGGAGPVLLDLVRDGPHALIAGTTGAGKSELLRCLVTGLALSHPPDALSFVLIDYKGGAAFADCARLPHTVGMVTDLDAHLAARALRSLQCELRRRERLLASAGARDLLAYRASAGAEALPRLVIVVDEFAELATELAGFVDGLVGIARRGRSLGVHLVLATQRPAGVVSPEIRANTAIRIALRVTDAADSLDVIDTADAMTIERRYPGRAYVQVPGSTPALVQTALVALPGRDPGDSRPALQVIDLDAWRRPSAPGAAAAGPSCGASGDAAGGGLGELTAVLRSAATAWGHDPPGPAPWLDPLPRLVPLEQLAAGGAVPIGLVDLPGEQRQEALLIDLQDGDSVLFAGGARSGRTQALLTLAVSAAARASPARLHLHVADFAGGGLAVLSALPQLGSFTGADTVATARLLTRLHEEVERRRAQADSGRGEPALLLLLDGWEQFLAAAEQHEASGPVETLLALLRSGPSVGLTIAIAGDRGALVPRLASAIGTKLILRLTDRADYALAGLRERDLPTEFPPGRAVRASDGAEVQLALPGGSAVDAEAIHELAARRRQGNAPDPPTGLIRVRPLPPLVRLETLRAPLGRAARAAVVLGVGGDAAEPLAVDLLAGRARLLVAGPPVSGRSTLLLSLLVQLVAGGIRTIVVAPPRSPLYGAAGVHGVPVLGPDGATTETAVDVTAGTAGPAVLLMDDCETACAGRAGELLTSRIATRTDLAVVLAGRSDDLAVTFRGPAAEVRSARCAVLLRPGPGDGELAGVRLPPRRAGGPPGRGLVIGDPAWGPPFGGAPVPLQVALPGPSGQRPASNCSSSCVAYQDSS